VVLELIGPSAKKKKIIKIKQKITYCKKVQENKQKEKRKKREKKKKAVRPLR
jgi:hypothetical protein